MPTREIILGIDYGQKRVGLALAQSDSMAVPYKVLSNNGQTDLLHHIRQVIEQENVTRLVVGLPYSLSGQPNQKLAETQAFVDWLKSNLLQPVETVDERMTSALYTKQGVKEEVDKHAAAAILDSYLQRQA